MILCRRNVIFCYAFPLIICNPSVISWKTMWGLWPPGWEPLQHTSAVCLIQITSSWTFILLFLQRCYEGMCFMAAYLSVVSLLMADTKISLLKIHKVDSVCFPCWHPRWLREDRKKHLSAKVASNFAYVTSLAGCAIFSQKEKFVQDKVL